jgi:hypothetical protein
VNVRIAMLMALLVSHSVFAGSVYNNSVAPDLSGNGDEEAVILAIKPSSDSVRIKLRDLGSGDNVGTFDEEDF